MLAAFDALLNDEGAIGIYCELVDGEKLLGDAKALAHHLHDDAGAAGG